MYDAYPVPRLVFVMGSIPFRGMGGDQPPIETMPEEIQPEDLTGDWNQTKDKRDEKQFIDGDDPRTDWSVTLTKRGGSWGYVVSKPGYEPESQSALEVKAGETFLNALNDAEGVVAREQSK